MSNRQIIEISTRTIAKTLLLILGLATLYILRDIVVLLLLSIVIASAIEPGVRRLQLFRFPRPLAVLAIYIGTAGVFALTFYLLVPPLVGELRNFATVFPTSLNSAIDRLHENAGALFSYAPEYISISTESLRAQLDAFIDTGLFSFFSLSSSIGSSLFGGALSFVLTIVLSFYFAVQENGIANFLKIITPREYEDYSIGLWTRSQRKIGKWLQGQLLLGLLVGILVYLGLTLLGVRYALLLAVVAAIFELIPVFGPILAAIPSVLLAFIQAPLLAVWVILLYIIVQQLENHLIYPLVVRKAVGVPPLLVIISLLVGANLGGFVGIVLAVPVAAAILEYVDDVAKEKHVFEQAP